MNKTAEQPTITIHVPLHFAIRGGRKTIIFDATAAPPQRRSDNALLRAIARAYRWRKKIESGEYLSITELAKAQKINQSYACRILRLTLLAPVVVMQILDGSQNPDLLLDELTKPLPTRWEDQVRMLA